MLWWSSRLDLVRPDDADDVVVARQLEQQEEDPALATRSAGAMDKAFIRRRQSCVGTPARGGVAGSSPSPTTPDCAHHGGDYLTRRLAWRRTLRGNQIQGISWGIPATLRYWQSGRYGRRLGCQAALAIGGAGGGAGNAAGVDVNGEVTWTFGLTCQVLGGALLSAFVTLYLRKQRGRKIRHDGKGRVGKERHANNNQI